MRRLGLFLMSVWLIGTCVYAGDPLTLALVASTKTAPRTLADIVDRAATSPALISRYGDLSLAGFSGMRRIAASQVLLLLTRAGADLSSIVLRGGDVVEVEGASSQRVVRLAETAVAKRIAQAKNLAVGDVTVELAALPPEVVNLPNVTDVTASCDPAQLANGADLPVRLQLLGTAGQMVRELVSTAQVKTREAVVVAQHALAAGARVTRDDFRVETIAVAPGLVGYRELKALSEQPWIVSEALAAGAPLQKSQVRDAVVMRRGAIVTLVSRDAKLHVRTLGRIKSVLEDGGSVLVENLASKKELVGRPVNAGEVEIPF